ncbi:hypothetical protein, partial [Mycoplasmopsis bovis]|uniref:hypothetical protein n=1 Tax=Mycoplasmopsis bovis TaxID=28903 RepID=UPI003D2D5FC8
EPCFEIFSTLSDCNAFSFKPGISFFTKSIISFSVGKLSFVMINPKLVLLISELKSTGSDYIGDGLSSIILFPSFNFNSSISTGSDFNGDE